MTKKNITGVILVLIVFISIFSNFKSQEKNKGLLGDPSITAKGNHLSDKDKTKANTVPQTSSIKNNYIITCDIENLQKESLDEKKYASWIEYVSENGTEDDKFKYILSGQHLKYQNNFQFLLEYSKNNPTDKLAYYYLLGLCARDKNIEQCDDDIFNKTKFVDKNNAALSLSIASLNIQQGNTDKALENIQRAIYKDHFTNYHFENINYLYQYFSQNIGLSFSGSLVAAIGIQAAIATPEYITVIRYCKENGQQNIVIGDACFQLGKFMIQKGSNNFIHQMGTVLQNNFYSQTSKTKTTEQLSVNYNNASGNILTSKLFNKATQLMLFDESLVNVWLKTSIESGELNGAQTLINEAILLSKNKYYQPCQPRSE